MRCAGDAAAVAQQLANAAGSLDRRRYARWIADLQEKV
jgi:hypothetical protein